MTNTESKTPQQTAPEFLAVRAATIEKGNGGSLGYEVGKHVATGEPALRVVSNSSSGTFSKEWILFAAIRKALAGADERFPASTLATAINAKGKNNAFFIAAALVGEGLLARHADGGLTLAGDWQAWGDTVRALPLPEIPKPPDPPVEPKGKSAAPPPEGASVEGESPKATKRAGKKVKTAPAAPPPPEPETSEPAPPDAAEPVAQEAGS